MEELKGQLTDAKQHVAQEVQAAVAEAEQLFQQVHALNLSVCLSVCRIIEVGGCV